MGSAALLSNTRLSPVQAQKVRPALRSLSTRTGTAPRLVLAFPSLHPTAAKAGLKVCFPQPPLCPGAYWKRSRKSLAQHHTCDSSLTARSVATARSIAVFVKQHGIALRGGNVSSIS